MSLKDAFNRANPNTHADWERLIALGDVLLGSLPTMRGRFNFDASGASASHVATLDHMPLDGGAKAATILRAHARAGGALSATGALTVAAFGATPATTEIAIAPNGDIVALAADALTDVDVYYIPFKGELKTITVAVDPATGIALLPNDAKARGVIYLHKATALAGTVTGQKRILVNGAVNPATPQCRLSVARDQVNFTVADAITSAELQVVMLPLKDLYAQLLAPESST